MAFIVETGTGISDANAYSSLVFFQSYWADRGGDLSAYTDSQIQYAIVQATDYIDRTNGSVFVGQRMTDTQSLEWPRVYAYYKDDRAALGVPIEVQKATAEYALRALTAPLAPDPVYPDTNSPVTDHEEQVGPIREKYSFGGGGAVYSFRKYPIADSLLKPLITRGDELLRV